MSSTLPPECRIDLSIHIPPGGVRWGATTVGGLMEHPEAEAVFAGPLSPGAAGLHERLTGKPGCQFGIKWTGAGVPALSAESIRAEMTRAASRLPADIGWDDVRKVAVWEMPVIDEHYWFWLEPLA